MKTLLTVLVSLFVLINTSHANSSNPTLGIVFAGSPTGSVNKFNKDLAESISKFYNIKEIPGISSTKGLRVYEKASGVPTILYTRAGLHNAKARASGKKPAVDINKNNIVLGLNIYDMVCTGVQNPLSASQLIVKKNNALKIGMSDSMPVMKGVVDNLGRVTGSKHILIPFKGSQEAAAGLQTGELDVSIFSPITAMKYQKGGTIKCDTHLNPKSTEQYKSLTSVLNDNWFGFYGSKQYMIVVKNADAKFTQQLKKNIASAVADKNTAIYKRVNGSFMNIIEGSSSKLYKDYSVFSKNKARYSK